MNNRWADKMNQHLDQLHGDRLSVAIAAFTTDSGIGRKLKAIESAVNGFDGSIEWGHITCADCELAINQEGNWSINVYIDKDDPEGDLRDAIALHLVERFPELKDKIAVICEW